MRRLQILTACLLEIGMEQRLQFSNALPRLLLHAQFVANESWQCLQDCLEKLQMSPAELEIQADFMIRFYNKPVDEAPRTVYYDNEICEVLLCRQVLLEYIEGLFSATTCPPPGQWQRLRQYLAEQVCGRIPVNDQQPAMLEKKLEELFHRTGSCIRDWIAEDGQHQACKRAERARCSARLARCKPRPRTDFTFSAEPSRDRETI